MDTAVALVQAYLQVNGYFTVCEYPILESARGDTRTATDIDVLAFRFPGAGREVGSHRRRVSGTSTFEADPHLGCPAHQADMIVGEVKEGRARFNPPARDPMVLAGALARFGCCPPDASRSVVEGLLRHGVARTPHGHEVRMVVFGSRGKPGKHAAHRVITLDHVTGFLRDYLQENWDTLHAADIKLPALDLLALLHKARRATEEHGT